MARDRDMADIGVALANLSAAVVNGFAAINSRLDTLIDSVADLRADLNRHIEEGHES